MDAIWKIERALWLEGGDAYARYLAEDCLMAFGPSGILRKPAILDSLRHAPRWNSVEMSEQILTTPGDTIAIILAYRAEARRDGQDPYRALCSSTYLILDGTARLAQHQQTPL